MIKTIYIAGCFALLATDAAQAAINPWFGIWQLRLKSPDEKPETLIYSDAGSGAMRMASVEENSVIVTRFDGRPATDIATKADGGRTLAIKAVSPTSYTWTLSIAGKSRVKGINTLAADRKTFTEVSWLVSKPSRTVTLVYDRQEHSGAASRR